MNEKKLPTQDEIENACKKLAKGAREFFNKHGYILTEEDEVEMATQLIDLCHKKMSDKKRLSKGE